VKNANLTKEQLTSFLFLISDIPNLNHVKTNWSGPRDKISLEKLNISPPLAEPVEATHFESGVRTDDPFLVDTHVPKIPRPIVRKDELLKLRDRVIKGKQASEKATAFLNVSTSHVPTPSTPDPVAFFVEKYGNNAGRDAKALIAK